MILIDAQKGILPQSKRHAFIASLLGVQHVVAAVNKMDLVGYDRAVFDRICDEFRAFAPKLALKDIVFIPLSALAGDNVVERSANMPWYDGTTLLNHLETVHIAGDQNLIDFRFPVQYVLRPDANFRGYAGPDRRRRRARRRRGGRPSLRPAQPHHAHRHARRRPGLRLPADVRRDLPGSTTATSAAATCSSIRPTCRAWTSASRRCWSGWTRARCRSAARTSSSTPRASCAAHVASLHYRLDPNDLHRQDAPELGLNEIGRVRDRDASAADVRRIRAQPPHRRVHPD